MDGFLFFRNRLYLPDTSMRVFFIRELHSGGIVGHFGHDKTIQLVEDKFWWPSLKQDVQWVVQRYRVCQLSKGLVHSSTRTGSAIGRC